MGRRRRRREREEGEKEEGEGKKGRVEKQRDLVGLQGTRVMICAQRCSQASPCSQDLPTWATSATDN